MLSEDFKTRAEHLVDTRSVGVGAWLYRRTDGRITRLWRRRALLLTTTGRRSGLPRTVIVQLFPDGEDLVVVAANSGLPTHPAWYLNLMADPRARVEVEGRTLQVRAEQLSASEAEEFWPRVLAIAPDYDRYRRRTDRVIPLLRLVRQDDAPDQPPAAGGGGQDSGTWAPGMPYLRRGQGPPLLFLPGLTTHHGTPHGVDRAAATGVLRGLAQQREVWWVNRRAGLPPTVGMADLAADYAAGIRAHHGAPVDVIGVSTGGSVALQLTADHPDVVRRLVLVSAACRLGPRGKAAQRALARALSAGEPRTAGAAMLGTLGTPVTGPLWKAVGWLLGPRMFRHDPADLLATVKAEDAFDLTDVLPRIQAPVLVLGGDRDQPYGPALLAETAASLPRGRLLLYRRSSHAAVPSRRRFTADVLDFLDEESHGEPPPERGGGP